MLTKTVKTTKQVPVKVKKFTWHSPVTNPDLFNLPCSACKNPIGQNRWGIAWTIDNESMRLCEKCGVKAKQALGEDNE